MASVSDFFIDIEGKGGHGASPNQTADPVVCGAQIITALQTIVSRNIDPLDRAVVSVTRIEAGTATNIIPQRATMSGTYRTFTTEVRDFVGSRIEEIASNIAKGMGCTARVRVEHYTTPVINNADTTERLKATFERIGQSRDTFVEDRTMGGEDVGEFMTDTPGTFFFVGSGNSSKGLDYPHHHPRFDFDENALPMSVALLSAAVADYVLPQDEPVVVSAGA